MGVMFDLRLVYRELLRNYRTWLSMSLIIGVVTFWVLSPVFFEFRHSTAAAQDSIAGQTDIGLQRRQVVALERIARELRTANQRQRRCQ